MSQTVISDPETQRLVREGLLALSKSQYSMAYSQLRQAADRSPNDAVVLGQFGRLCVMIGRSEEAKTALERAVAIKPDHAISWFLLGMSYQQLNVLRKAFECFDKALALKPGDEIITAMKASLHQLQREHDDALSLIQPLLARDPVHPAIVTVFLRLAKHFGREEEAVALAQKCLPTCDRENAIHLLFALGDLFDSMERYHDALAAWSRANVAKSATYDPATFQTAVDGVIAAWNSERLRSMPQPGILSDRPVFVVGMPRSGTTLVEQILGSHPEIFGAGELPTLPKLVRDLTGFAPAGVPLIVHPEAYTADVIRQHASEYIGLIDSLAPVARKVIDKMPINFSCLGYIQTLFPQAKVIHITRDPLDTCLSCYAQHFTGFMPYTYNLIHLGHFYGQYVRLMEHWKRELAIPILDVRYESLVASTETEAKRLLKFLGLPWDPSVLQFHQRDDVALTASHAQVRRPVYSSSVGRSRRYGQALDPLRKALGPHCPSN